MFMILFYHTKDTRRGRLLLDGWMDDWCFMTLFDHRWLYQGWVMPGLMGWFFWDETCPTVGSIARPVGLQPRLLLEWPLFVQSLRLHILSHKFIVHTIILLCSYFVYMSLYEVGWSLARISHFYQPQCKDSEIKDSGADRNDQTPFQTWPQ